MELHEFILNFYVSKGHGHYYRYELMTLITLLLL